MSGSHLRRDSQVTVTDLFCGAGGWTEGVEQAGALVKWGVNHWARACETYGTNHPKASVDCNDISATNPGRYPRTDVLIASPECTTHSPAGGSRPKARRLFADEDPAVIAELARIERSRVTMLDVVRFAEHHRYDAIIVENVVEVRRWELYDWWLTGMLNLGYETETVFMNSMVAWPTPQSRDRIYIVFWRKGNRKPDLRFDVACWCPKCERDVQGIQSWKDPTRPWGKYRTQYVYRCPSCATAAWPYAYPAATAIDWSLDAPRIGDRKRPLAPATMRRIEAGLERFGPAAIVTAAGNTYEAGNYRRSYGVDEPIPTQATTIQHGLVVDTAYGGSVGHIKPTDEPMAAQTARQSHALVVPLRNHGRAERADRRPMTTIAANGTHQALLTPPFLAIMRSDNTRVNGVDEPLPTVVASGGFAGLVQPPVPFIDVGQGEGRQYGIDEPLTTITTIDTKHRLVTPPGFVMRNNKGGAEMSTSLDEPVRTVTSKGHQSLVTTPFLTEYHGQGGAAPVTQPMGVVDTRDRRGLVLPAIAVEDCGFRMLEPHEIKAAMAFPESYVITGNKREQVKQCGNAVTPPVSKLIFARVAASLQGVA